MAMAMEKPLLLTGEAGTGKTQLAFQISKSLNLDIEIARCKSTFKGEELCYVQDTVLRLNDSRFGAGETGRKVSNFYDYIIWGPIGRAFRAEKKVVLLLDEIDKTDSDTQDNLLDVLEEGSFVVRETNETIKAKYNPIIIITSNAKRELSDPFLRRCYCHYIPFPTRDEMEKIVGLHYSDIKKGLLKAGLDIFYDLRNQGFEKLPATAELLDWIGAYQKINKIPDKQNLRFVGALLKRTEDILKYRGVGLDDQRVRERSFDDI